MKTLLRVLLALALLCTTAQAATLTVGYGTAAAYIRIQTGPSTYVAADCTVGSGATAGRLTIAESTIAALSGMSVPGTYPFVVYLGTASTSASDTAISGGKLYWDGTQDTGNDNSKFAALTWSVVATCYAGSTTGINVTTSTANSTGADYGFANVVSLSAGSPPVLTDNKGNKWEVVEVVTEGWVEMITYECKNPRVGTGHTLTATSDGKSPAVFAIFTSGVRRSGSHVDQAASAHTFTGTTQAPGSITPSENNCLVLTSFLCGGSGSISVGESYTANSLQMNAAGAHIGGGLAYKIQTTATATNPTWTQAGTGSIGAAIYSFLPQVTATKYITLDQFQDRQVVQREAGTTQKKVSVSGKYYGQAPSSVEVQVYKWRASGSVGALVQDYKPVEGLLCSSGSWSGVVSVPQGGWYRARARSRDINGTILATGLYANNRWGVGANYLVVGQSNAYKLFQDYYVLGSAATASDTTASFVAGAWGTNTGEGATALANALTAKTNYPIGLANYAVSGAGIVYDAGSGEWQSQAAGKPWPLAQAGIAAIGGDIEGIICQGCEADAENPSFDATALKAGLTTLYGRIVAETPRTAATLPFIICIPGPLNDPATTDAKWDTIRTTVPAWADATEGAMVGGSLADGTLADAYHFGGADYAHNGLRLAQSILYRDGLAENSGRPPQIFKAWRFSGSPIIYVQNIGLGNSGLAELDGTTDGASLTGFQVSDDAWSTTETISSTAIEGNIIKLTLAATPTDGATVVVRSQYGKTPTITNLPYRNANPQGDDRGLPLMPSGEVSVELRTAFDSDTDTMSQATLAKEYPIDFGYTRKTANGAVAAARATSNVTLVSETETEATVSSYTTQSTGALVWDNGTLAGADKLQQAGSGGTSGSFTETERAQILASLSLDADIGVPAAQTWVIKRIDGKMKAVAAIPKDTAEEIEVAADFRSVLAPGDAIAPTGGIEGIELIDDGNTGTVDSTAFDSVSNAEIWMASAVKFTITGGSAGQTDRIRVKVRTVGGQLLSAPCSVSVKDGD